MAACKKLPVEREALPLVRAFSPVPRRTSSRMSRATLSSTESAPASPSPPIPTPWPSTSANLRLMVGRRRMDLIRSRTVRSCAAMPATPSERPSRYPFDSVKCDITRENSDKSAFSITLSCYPRQLTLSRSRSSVSTARSRSSQRRPCGSH